MAVFQPTYKDPRKGEQKFATVWWYDFIFAGKRIRESAKTTSKTLARISVRLYGDPTRECRCTPSDR